MAVGVITPAGQHSGETSSGVSQQCPVRTMSDVLLKSRGSWWLPAKPGQVIPGELAVAAEDIPRLVLSGTFSDDPEIAQRLAAPAPSPYQTELILGRLDDGTPCTLCKNVATYISPHETHIGCRWVLSGSHFEKPNLLQFRTLSFRLRHLEEWTGETPLQKSRPSQDDFQLQLKRATTRKPEVLLDITPQSDGPVTRLRADLEYWPKFGFRTFIMQEVARITLTLARSMELAECSELVADFGNLFSILMSEDANPFALRVSTQPLDDTPPSLFGPTVFWGGMGTPAETEIYPRDMLQSYSKKVTRILETWCVESTKLREAVQWLAAPTRLRTYEQTAFVNYCQAAEALHRAIHSDPFMMKPLEYEPLEKALIAAIPQSIDDDVRNKLVGAIHYSNQTSFRRQLRDFFSVIFGDDNRDRFVDRIYKTRNYFVHHDPNLADKAASGQELFELTIILRNVVTIRLLEHLGLSLTDGIYAAVRLGGLPPNR